MRNPFARKRDPEPVVAPEPPLTRHLANVDLRSTGEYFVTTYSYDHRLAILDGPPVVLAAGATAHDLGTETLAALLRTGRIVAPANMRTDPVPSQEGLLKRAKVKTFTGYMRGTKSVSVFADFEGEVPHTYRITPLKPEGGRGARTQIDEKIVTEPYSDTEALGAAVLRAIDDATS